MADEPEPTADDGAEEGWAFHTFLDLGLSPVEALALVNEGVSASAVRELVHHGADVRTAVSILL